MQASHKTDCKKVGSKLDNTCERCRQLFRMLHILRSTPRSH